MREYKSRPNAGESLIEQLQSQVIDDYKRGCKTSRAYPRKKRRLRRALPRSSTPLINRSISHAKSRRNCT